MGFINLFCFFDGYLLIYFWQIQEEVKKFAYDTGVKIVVAYGGAPIVHQVRFCQGYL